MINLGSGSTWPGHIALNINKNFIKQVLYKNKNLRIILIAGTNGKTTTCKLIHAILEKSGKKVFQNESGANLLNGIASSMLLRSNILCEIKYNYVIFEVDENTLPLILQEFTPDYLTILNLFRDQLDRYGELNTILTKWKAGLTKLTTNTKLILNADDPKVVFLGLNRNGVSIPPLGWRDNALFFGLDDKRLTISTHQHASDSTYCPNCDSKLYYNSIYYSHLGDWKCSNCNFKRPKLDISKYDSYPLPGIYNRYNTLAAILTTKRIGISNKHINSALHEFTPAFGRQEKLNIGNKNVQIFLSKNPTSFNESLRTISDLDAKNVLFVLNDQIPDGRDISWIWDVDFEDYVNKFNSITVSGDRAYDMGLRIRYAMECQKSKYKSQNCNSKFKTYEELGKAVDKGLNSIKNNETLFILPTYSAMLEVRKILTGKKIL